MTKMVVYNGETMSYYNCSSPNVLQMGRMYEVIQENDRAWQTDYTLKGVNGQFNSCWFNEAPSFFAITKEIPRLGECLKYFKVCKEGEWVTMGQSSTIGKIEQISSTTYIVYTSRTIYVVNVI